MNLTDTTALWFKMHYQHFDWCEGMSYEEFESVIEGIKRSKDPDTSHGHANAIRKFLSEIVEHEELLKLSKFALVIPDIRIVSKWDDLSSELAKRPEDLYSLPWKDFEDLVSHLLEKMGWNITPIGRTKDGGIDIIAAQTLEPQVNVKMLVQCKRYAQHRKVGIQVVKEVWATMMSKNFQNAMLVTSSTFTAPVINQNIWHLELRDHNSIIEWCTKHSSQKMGSARSGIVTGEKRPQTGGTQS